VTTPVGPRIAILSALNTPPYDGAAGVYATPLGEVVQLLDAYRAAVVAEVVEALQERGGELSELAEEQMRPSLEETAQEWHRAAELVARIARTTPTATEV
jgi:acyl-CoA reductase-like NAD-dependent aldehyde dehydrogenase